jgi:hypothetical protein
VFYPLRQPGENGHIPLRGQGFSGRLEIQPAAGEENWLSLTLNDRLPLGFWRLSLWLEGRDEEVAIKLSSHDPLENRILFSGPVRPGPQGKVDIPFVQSSHGAQIRLETRLGQANSRLTAFALSSDVRAHLGYMADCYWQAIAGISFAGKNFSRTLQALEAIRAPLSEDLLLMKASSLLSTAAGEKVEEILALLWKNWQDQPERLALLRGLYASLRQEEKTAEIDRRLAALRPSISRYARFQGGMSLLGYDWAEGPAGEGSLTFRLYWQAWEKPLLDSDIVVTIAGPGAPRQFSRRLAESGTAMTSLKPGQVLVDEWKISGMTPGNYRFLLRLDDSYRNGQSLNIIEGAKQNQNELPLLNLELR